MQQWKNKRVEVCLLFFPLSALRSLFLILINANYKIPYYGKWYEKLWARETLARNMLARNMLAK